MSNINQYPLEATQINDEDFYDVDYWNGASYETRKISGATLKANLAGSGKNISSSQWQKTLAAPSSLKNGEIANGFTFFLETDKVSAGTTSYDEYFLSYGISLLFTGSSGSGTITINSIGYGITFNVDLPTTISDFITANAAAIEADADIRIFQVGDNMRFCGPEAKLNAILYVQNAADLSATLENEFTGGAVASPDHVVIPYVGEPYENKRLHHTFRVNFDIVAGSDQTLALSLRRFEDDSVIGSEIQVFRNQDVEGVQKTFATYTASASDPFVTGGFYFALRNDSGVTVEISGNVGILIQNEFENPTIF